jgi:hypothetical protein
MSDAKENVELQTPNWIYVAIWIVSLIIMWIIYGVFAPNLALFIIALVITVGGPGLYYGLLLYKTTRK